MTQRGRGTLEVNPSRNPFFQTTSSDIGATINERAQMDWERPRQSLSLSSRGGTPETNTNSTGNGMKNKDEDFSFLYTRSSDAIGGKIEKKPNALAMCMDTAPPPRRRLMESGAQVVGREEPPKKDVEAILQNYHHNPKDENPLYTTSGNDYGRKIPSVATFVADRAYRPQDFSKSFNGIKPKNSSLNTSISKSTVHPKLDPQFM